MCIEDQIATPETRYQMMCWSCAFREFFFQVAIFMFTELSVEHEEGCTFSLIIRYKQIHKDFN